jgi:hypothetical protein
MSERETAVELPFAADCCPSVEKLRAVLPLTVGIRDGVVHLVAEERRRGRQRRLHSADEGEEERRRGRQRRLHSADEGEGGEAEREAETAPLC